MVEEENIGGRGARRRDGGWLEENVMVWEVTRDTQGGEDRQRHYN